MTFVKGQKVSRAAVRIHPSFLFQRNDDEREFQSLFFKSVEQVVSVSLSLSIASGSFQLGETIIIPFFSPNFLTKSLSFLFPFE